MWRLIRNVYLGSQDFHAHSTLALRRELNAAASPLIPIQLLVLPLSNQTEIESTL